MRRILSSLAAVVALLVPAAAHADPCDTIGCSVTVSVPACAVAATTATGDDYCTFQAGPNYYSGSADYTTAYALAAGVGSWFGVYTAPNQNAACGIDLTAQLNRLYQVVGPTSLYVVLHTHCSYRLYAIPSGLHPYDTVAAEVQNLYGA